MLAQTLRGRHALAKGPLYDLGACQSRRLQLWGGITYIHSGGERVVVGRVWTTKEIVGMVVMMLDSQAGSRAALGAGTMRT